MSNQTVHLHHYSITAPAEVITEMVDFYRKALAFEPGYRPDFGINGEWLYSGDHPILHLVEDPGRSGEKSGYFDHIALRCEDLAAMTDNLKSHDIPYFEFLNEELQQHQLFINDPAGTTVELNYQL